MRQNDGLTDCQAETNTRHSGLKRAGAAEKWLEDLLVVRRRDTWTSILDDQRQLLICRHTRRDVDWSVGRCVFDCVLQQIRQDTLHLAHVDTRGWQVGRHVAPYDPVSNHAAYAVHGALNQVGGACKGRVSIDLPNPITASGVKQRLDQLGHAIGLELNLRQHFLTGLRVPLHVVAPQCADEPLDVTQGQTQLVGNRGRGLL
jgi:hypothetical protein